MTPDRIRALRLMSAELDDLLRRGDDVTDAEIDRLMALGGTLTGSIPALLDEVERLQAERTEGGRPRVRTFVKPDRMGGQA